MSRVMSTAIAAALLLGGLSLSITDASAHQRKHKHKTKVSVHNSSVVVDAPGGVFVSVNWRDFVSVNVHRNKKRIYKY
jgi:DNA/RNA-binding domain of Phe-tRNA-synthetase-like protein